MPAVRARERRAVRKRRARCAVDNGSRSEKGAISPWGAASVCAGRRRAETPGNTRSARPLRGVGLANENRERRRRGCGNRRRGAKTPSAPARPQPIAPRPASGKAKKNCPFPEVAFSESQQKTVRFPKVCFSTAKRGISAPGFRDGSRKTARLPKTVFATATENFAPLSERPFSNGNRKPPPANGRGLACGVRLIRSGISAF